MSSEKFENLEDDLSTAIDRLRPIISDISSQTGEQKKNAIRQAERKLEEANFLMHEMENEAKIAPVQYRTQMLGRLRQFKRNLEDLTRDLKRKKEVGFSSADNLGLDRDDRLEASQRNRLIQGTQSLNRTSESIARSQQIAAETDQVGVEIIDELGRQREVLTRTKGRAKVGSCSICNLTNSGFKTQMQSLEKAEKY
ncbi:vesicle transport through interaction with t-SNAREs homolog 1B-like isoform X2 [Dreissena polymorpha]|uniref:vesicle transport through interaction with t-SNAREs homolog 1B-like isoform X2 n=1 Tax=Dreissena polymorpha TaxID=45954 RepID=UPI002263C705|nr:vesicle transport through interaction with t-SNAREs homolog 1B-like isoform X2 [Dreissena polymorpha]